MTPLFERDGFIVCFEALPECEPVRRQFLDCGWTEEEIADIQRKVDYGELEWFTARVTAWKDRRKCAETYLGACLYASSDEFIEAGGYLSYMVDTVIQKAKEAALYESASTQPTMKGTI